MRLCAVRNEHSHVEFPREKHNRPPAGCSHEASQQCSCGSLRQYPITRHLQADRTGQSGWVVVILGVVNSARCVLPVEPVTGTGTHGVHQLFRFANLQEAILVRSTLSGNDATSKAIRATRRVYEPSSFDSDARHTRVAFILNREMENRWPLSRSAAEKVLCLKTLDPRRPI